MNKRVFSKAEWLLLFAVLAWLIALGLGGLTLFFSVPEFTALQQRGIQKNASVFQKLPYRSLCKDRTCTPFALRVSFSISNPARPLGELKFADLVVSEAEYNNAKLGDTKRIIFLEEKPDKIRLAQQTLAWTPWGNFAATIVLLMIGGVCLFSSRQLQQKRI